MEANTEEKNYKERLVEHFTKKLDQIRTVSTKSQAELAIKRSFEEVLETVIRDIMAEPFTEEERLAKCLGEMKEPYDDLPF